MKFDDEGLHCNWFWTAVIFLVLMCQTYLEVVDIINRL